MSLRLLKVFFQFQRTNICKTVSFNVLRITKMPYYAVAKGRTPGIYMSWGDCEAQVKGFSGARYKKFDTVNAAEQFITAGGPIASNVSNNKASFSEISKPSYSGTSNANLKRSYTKYSNHSKQSAYQKQSSGKPKNYKKYSYSENDTYDSDYSDSSSDSEDDAAAAEIERELSKQLDAIEKRVNSVGKGIERIIKKNTVKTGKQSILIDPPQPKRRKSTNCFDVDEDGFVQVYTDGACSANGRQGARAGLGVYWGDGHHLNISEPVSGRATNNCGEIQAATKAIRQALENGVTKLAINTDSKFLINSVTKWMPGWKRKGWKLQSGEPVKNEIDFKELDGLQNQLQIKWNYVEAHKGVHGNEMADQLARAGAAMYGMI